jgi:Asp-tRNA(Asn)/Glu-tRNA(Gln) amidotransferase A subunit family amidase
LEFVMTDLGITSAREHVEACLAAIDAREAIVKAWHYLDREQALRQADALDAERRAGRVRGPLHGVAVGIKDIYDTADMPTENGSALHAGRRPTRNAEAVARLRGAGAVILGKTVTTEFANMHPGKTANPHDPRRTPGGSSSGSAAGVAAGMMPLATGSQTNGSVIRPAAFCGVVGFKPTHGLIPLDGVLQLSWTLDHGGVFARDVDGAAVIAEVMTRTAMAPMDLGPLKVGFARTPVWDKADADTQRQFEQIAQDLNATPVELPAEAMEAHSGARMITDVEMAANLAQEYETGRHKISAVLNALFERGRRHTAFAYLQAVETAKRLRPVVDDLLAPFDAVLTPATPGPAPLGLETTGNPVFCTLWTILGTPAITLPLLQSPEGMPLGVQLVAARGQDRRLLSAAKLLMP